MGSVLDPQFTGGYLGLETFYSETEFKDIKYIVYNNDEDAISDITAENFEFEYEKGIYGYETDKSGIQPLTIKIESPDEYSIYINGTEAKEAAVDMTSARSFLRITSIRKSDLNRTDIIIMINISYSEPYRAQYHFSPKTNWINDPNGLLYDASTGEYHIFYQYCKSITADGQLYWGHAVTKDLVHYEELEPALAPDDYGVMWSGSGVIDRQNSSGLFDKNVPSESRIVLIYSSVKYDVNVDGTLRRIEQQSLAYSEDHGRTFKKYKNGAPIISNGNYQLGELRDAKIVWMNDEDKENGGFWLMITAGYTKTRLWTSDNLIDWKLNSEVFDKDGLPLTTECPDIFELAVDGDDNNKKWVLSAGGTFYIIGEIKELCGNYYFKAETDKQTAYLTHTDENISWSSLGGAYATVSFYNDALNRRIMVSWMIDISASSLSGKTWNGMLSSFMETTLKTVNNQIQLISYPVEEYETLRRETVKTLENSTVTDTNAIKGINSDIFDCEISFDAGQNGILKLVFAESGDKNSIILYDCENNILTLDLSNSGKIVKSVLSAKIVPSNGKITLRIMVDRSIVEIYANGGENVIQSLYYAPEGADILSLTSEGDVILNSFEMYSMDSCWEEVK